MMNPTQKRISNQEENFVSQALVFAICCMSAAQARPGGYLDLAALGLSGGQSGGQGGGSPPPGNYQLVGVPDESAYADLTFPEQPIQDLGTISEGEVPADSVRVTKTITIKVPQPYPVEVSNPVPYPVEVAKPYPVPVTKLVHVPHPVPFDVKGSDSGSHGGW